MATGGTSARTLCGLDSGLGGWPTALLSVALGVLLAQEGSLPQA